MGPEDRKSPERAGKDNTTVLNEPHKGKKPDTPSATEKEPSKEQGGTLSASATAQDALEEVVKNLRKKWENDPRTSAKRVMSPVQWFRKKG